MSVNYIPANERVTGWDALSQDLSLGINLVGSVSDSLKNLKDSITAALNGDSKGYDTINTDIQAIQSALNVAPESFKSNPALTAFVNQVNQVVTTTCANYEVVNQQGTVGGYINQPTAELDIPMNQDITDNYRHTIPGTTVQIDFDVKDVANSLSGDDPTVTKSYTVTDSSGQSYKIAITVTYDLSTGGVAIHQVVITGKASTCQQMVDGGFASVKQVPGTNGMADLDNLLKNLQE